MRRIALFIGLVVLGGCITPSIPIPPPDPARMSFAVTVSPELGSRATFTYEPDINYVGAVYFVYNRDRGSGIIENALPGGGVGPTAPVAAAVGEQIIVSVQAGDQSVSTCIRLRDGPQSSTDYCGP